LVFVQQLGRKIMRSKSFYLIVLLVIVAVSVTLWQNMPTAASAAPDVLTGYYNLMGYEGVGTVGENLANFGQVPPVGDYVTTHCRYINISPLNLREYYLRYFLHLPEGATLTQIDAHIADFAEIGSLGVELRSRPWNSRDPGNLLGVVNTAPGSAGDTTLTIPGLGVLVDNQATQYWIDVYFNQQDTPGQLCVYAIQATYTFNGSFLSLVRRGG
jgi:hypothetical protein